MNHRIGVRAWALLVLGAAQALPGLAAGSEGPASRIERVTVYPGLAEVERSARVASGARELVLDCLSASFDLASLRVEADAGIRIGPVSARQRPRSEAAECNVTPQDARVRVLEDRIAALQAESGGHDLALGYLRALAPGEGASAAARGVPAPGSAAALQATLGAIQKSGQNALAEQHRLLRELEALERELAPLRAEQERQRPKEGEVRQLRIALAATHDGGVRLRYQVAGPSWAPAYRATLDSATATVEIERLAQVSQRSGEDWTGVTLRLSTGSPRAATSGPAPRPWELSVRPPETFEPRPKAMALAAAPAPAPALMRSLDEAPPLDFAVQVSEGEFATEFEVPGRADVGSGAQRVGFSLGSNRWPVSVKVQTVPQADASAWVVAELARPEGVWPDGSLQLLRGTQVVGQGVWRSGTRERISLPFGRDELVRVRVLPNLQQQASGGFIGSRSERRVQHVFEVENRHRTPVDLQVLEASPFSTDEQISVTRQFNPAVLPGWWQDQPGVVAWAQSLAPGQSARFAADYLISHAKDLPINERR